MQFDDNPASELLDLANNVTGETASVYIEIGIQVGILLMRDMNKNIETKETKNIGKEDMSEDKKTISRLIKSMGILGSRESALTDIYKEREEGVIEDILKKIKGVKR